MALFSLSAVFSFCFSRWFISQATSNLSISAVNTVRALTHINPSTQPVTQVIIHHPLSSGHSTWFYLDWLPFVQKNSREHGSIILSTIHGGKRIPPNLLLSGQTSRFTYIDFHFVFPKNTNILQSTVLLAVDVSLLAIPALGGGGAGPNHVPSNSTSSGVLTSPFSPTPPTTNQQTAAIIAIFLSILFVVGALVTSMQLSDHLRGKEHSSATEAVGTCLDCIFISDWGWLTICVLHVGTQGKVLRRASKSCFGTDGLAIMFSLPYAFLIWGYVYSLIFQVTDP